MLVTFGLLLGVALLEGGLQVAARLVQAQARGGLRASWITGRVRILCLGDSNTYGLWVERNETYPSQLETLWNERIDSPKVEVLNLGFPGTNSSRLVRDLPKMLETLAPDVLILMIGVNDFWTTPFPTGQGTGPPAPGFLERHSKLYRASVLIRRGRDAGEPEIIRDPSATMLGAEHRMRVGDQEFDVSFHKRQSGHVGIGKELQLNVEHLVSEARARDTTVYLMSYPGRGGYYNIANPMIRAAADRTRAPLIDLTAAFDPLCPGRVCPELLFPDQHPKPDGYRLVAERLLARLSAEIAP